jgi:type III pantothenate kinase
MQLVIDVGNTLIKSYVFEGDQFIDLSQETLENWEKGINEVMKRNKQINKVILSDVNQTFSKKLAQFLEEYDVFHCSMSLKLPFTTEYSKNSSLGSDRIALLASCCLLYPKKEVLVIDLGSCITYDWINANGVHQGGAISPGFRMRYKGMHTFSGTLPLLNPEKIDSVIGSSTKEAMHSGVYNGILFEVGGIIDLYNRKIKNLTVILTGGDAEMLPKPFKNGIFAHSNFLAEGLNHLLVLNTGL